MAPIRRYLRITKYSVIECRIYLDDPALTHTWLLNPRKPVLPRVIESVRPYVLPKLREERERSRKRSTKKKGIKDVVVQDDFEASIFLTETTTRHSLLTKHKHFHDTTQTKLTSNSARLISAANETPIDVDAIGDLPPIRREESDDDAATLLATIPAVNESAVGGGRSKRARSSAGANAYRGAGDQHSDAEVISDDQGDTGEEEEEDGLFTESPGDSRAGPPPAKRRREVQVAADEDEDDDKKKLAMDISYEGFSIYGRVLCLVVKRREGGGFNVPGRSGSTNSAATAGKAKAGGGQAMMENFIISTQVPAGADAT